MELANTVVEMYWQPYHHRLHETLDGLRDRFGVALLYDAHSIRSEVPRFFEGRLPDLNLGTARGESCDPALESALSKVLSGADEFTHAINARFTGGYITRHYGRPAENIHAVQLEQAQVSYMNEDYPYDYREDLAERVRPTLKRLLQAMLDWVG